MPKVYLSPHTERFLPRFIVEEYPQFVAFVKDYFKYIEQDGQAYDLIANLLGHADIDKTVSDYYDHYRNTYLVELPDNFLVHFPLLVKRIRDYYVSKGTEASFQFLFRILYDVDVQFYYPSDDLLRVSDGKWFIPTYLAVKNIASGYTINDFLNKTITNGSGITAFVDAISYVEYPVGSGSYENTLSLTDKVGDFTAGDVIYVEDNTSQTAEIKSIAGGDPADGVLIKSGQWLNKDGMISESSKRLQDSYYWQTHSYELRTELTRSVFESMVKKILHPAGFKMFVLTIPGTITPIQISILLNDSDVISFIFQNLQNLVSLNSNYSRDLFRIASLIVRDYTYQTFELNREGKWGLARIRYINEIGNLQISEFTDKANDTFPFMQAYTVRNP